MAWLAPTLTVAGSVLFSAALLPAFGAGSAATAAHRSRDLERRAWPPPACRSDASGPVITDFPIWLPYVHGGTAAGPARRAARVRRSTWPGTSGARPSTCSGRDDLPAELATGSADAECFQEVDASRHPRRSAADELGRPLRVYRIVCP